MYIYVIHTYYVYIYISLALESIKMIALLVFVIQTLCSDPLCQICSLFTFPSFITCLQCQLHQYQSMSLLPSSTLPNASASDYIAFIILSELTQCPSLSVCIYATCMLPF